MVLRRWTTDALVDVINLALGGFLFLSPWLFGFTSELGWHTSWMAGATISILAIFSIADLFDSVSLPDFFESAEWINLAVGVWLALCPWILGFHGDATASQVHFVVGLVLATIAIVELWLLRRPHEQA
jgi:hypothetical protein